MNIVPEVQFTCVIALKKRCVTCPPTNMRYWVAKGLQASIIVCFFAQIWVSVFCYLFVSFNSSDQCFYNYFLKFESTLNFIEFFLLTPFT